MSARRAGFTLIEVLAVVLLTTLVIGVALSSYVDLSRGSIRATDRTRDVRRAIAVLDRVAHDYERTLLVAKPSEMDPLEHPWIFLGEARGKASASDRLKFMTRGHVPRRAGAPQSDFEVVTYAVREAPDATLELLRGSSAWLPERLDREVPDDESQGALLLADGLAGFGVRFIDEQGERLPAWDSSSLVQSGQLPAAVEIEVALADRDDPEAEPHTFQRRVVLPLRPLDYEELFDPKGAAGGGSGGSAKDKDGDGTPDAEEKGGGQACSEGPCAGLTVCQAVNCSQDYGPSVATLLEEIGGQPFCRWRSRFPNSLSFIILNPACR